MSSPLYKTCEICGNQFRTKLCHYESRRTCSKKCLGKLFSVEHIGKGNPHYKNAKKTAVCKFCGTEFSYWPSVRKNAACCSRECAGRYKSLVMVGENSTNWKGGNQSYYGSNWHINQDAARQRDNYTCQNCGITEDILNRRLDVHHLKPFRVCHDYLEANKLSNLISLCQSCHKLAEKTSWKKYSKPSFNSNVYIIESPWLTPKEAAKIIGFSVWGVYAAIRRGYIQAKNLCDGIDARKQPRFAIHIDDALSYKKRYK